MTKWVKKLHFYLLRISCSCNLKYPSASNKFSIYGTSILSVIFAYAYTTPCTAAWLWISIVTTTFNDVDPEGGQGQSVSTERRMQCAWRLQLTFKNLQTNEKYKECQCFTKRTRFYQLTFLGILRWIQNLLPYNRHKNIPWSCLPFELFTSAVKTSEVNKTSCYVENASLRKLGNLILVSFIA